VMWHFSPIVTPEQTYLVNMEWRCRVFGATQTVSGMLSLGLEELGILQE